MSKGYSNLFRGTVGSNPQIYISGVLHANVKTWAKKKADSLTGKAKKNFNTACAVYDEETGKYYYGRNGGINRNGFVKNPVLFGDGSQPGILPQVSLNKYPVGNCAEVDAINTALNAGAKLANLHLTTIHTTKNNFGNYKVSCENCTYAFKGRIKINYSGWAEGE